MSPDDPILAATTVTELIAAIDEVYDLDLPITVPPGTLLATLWAAGITVTVDPPPGEHYLAEGTEPIALPVLPPAHVRVHVDTPDSQPTPTRPTDQGGSACPEPARRRRRRAPPPPPTRAR